MERADNFPNRMGSAAGRLAAGIPFLPLLLVWVLTMIALPIVKHLLGDVALNAGVVLGVVLQVSFVLAVLSRAWGPARTVWVSGVVGALAWGVEALGSATGFPFGDYFYTDKLQPQLFHVPLLIPLAWLMMLPPAWAVAGRLAGSWRGLKFIALSALALTAWDLFLDPQMVAWDFWVWEQPGGYFGIPWINFAGWLLAAAVITALVRPGPLPARPLLLVYGVTWFLETFGLLFFWGLPGPALTGGAVMGLLLWLANTAWDRRE